MKAKDIMTNKIISVDKNTSVKEAATKMADTGVGSVIVNENNHIEGIITDRDIAVRAAAKYDNLNDVPCQEIMTGQVITAEEDTKMKEVINLMSDNQVKRIPIVEKEKVVGMVSLGDISQSYRWDNKAGNVLNDITEDSQNQTF